MTWLSRLREAAAPGEPSSLGPGWRAFRRADGSSEHRPVIEEVPVEEIDLGPDPVAAVRPSVPLVPRRALFTRDPNFPRPR